MNWTRRAAAALAAALLAVFVLPPPAWSAPVLTLSKSSGLADGERITVSGRGFTANLKQIAIGECIAEVKGPTDCNLAGGAQFVNADATGKIPTITLKLAKKFATFDCTKRQCVIAAQLIPSAATPAEVAANKAATRISFGTPAASKSPTPATSRVASPTTSSSAGLAKTGPGDERWVLILAGTALALPGIGLLLLLPRRRRTATAR
ncbi:neocarzinostatin apoprotein domain-containing protein [Hamadaea tsunoensis]|uniref:neocarzinostatin apoprotein domain-containing protein n=1 Tax=Hamadaea tsunoensis TaxID=53368 RepID=UPI0004279BA5|nr:neocarzinostatin apoprotein domain-containing protein [Hamadaea tsunoensis]